jgi:hypothetical protein
MAKTEAENRLTALKAIGLVQRCEPITGSFNFLLVRLHGVQTDPKAPDFDKSAYSSVHRLVRGALRDMRFELAPAVL